MLHATLAIDLPNEPYPTTGRVEALMRWVLERPDAQSGRRRVTADALTIIERLLTGFGAAGFDDVISVLVDRRPVYIDTQEQLGDLQDALEQTLACGALKDGLGDVSIVLSKHHDGLHTLAEVTINDDVLLHSHEVKIRLSSRISQWRVAPGDGPTEYRDRVLNAVRDGAFVEKVSAANANAETLAQALRTAMSESTVHVSPVSPRVVAPGPTQVGRFRHLGFRKRLRSRVYRPQKKTERIGAYDDPHVYYYYDPYHDLLSWVLVHAACSGEWTATGVEFLHPDGRALFSGPAPSGVELPVAADAVAFGEKELSVAEDIPRVGFDRAEVGSPHAPGWGGENA